MKILRELAAYYENTRQAGHTTLALEGLPDEGESLPPIMVVHDTTFGHQVRRRLARRPVQTMSIRQIEKGSLRGHREPLTFDNCAMMLICQQAADKIEALEEEIERFRS